MKLMTCILCGLVLDLDSVPKNPHQVCPGCKAPLDEEAVAHTFHPAEDPANLKDERRLASRTQLLADVQAMRGAAVDLGDVAGLASRVTSLESSHSSLAQRVATTESLITAAKPGA